MTNKKKTENAVGVWKDSFTIISGAARSKNLLYVALVGNEIHKNKISGFGLAIYQADKARDGQNPWANCGDFDWNCVSTVVVHTPKEQVVALGEWGEVAVVGSGDEYKEKIDTDSGSEKSPKDRGPLRAIALIGDHVYAAGMDNQVYCREGKNKWVCVDEGMRPKKTGKVIGFETIAGFSEKDIYAAGWDGLMWHYDGENWKEESNPTKELIVKITCAENGVVYAVDRAKNLLMKEKGIWKKISLKNFPDSIWDMAYFRDSLYVSTEHDVYVYNEKTETFEAIDWNGDIPKTCHHLTVKDSVMWSVGPKDILRFDGKKWSRVE